jgi:hypothetical protein
MIKSKIKYKIEYKYTYLEMLFKKYSTHQFILAEKVINSIESSDNFQKLNISFNQK